MSASEQERDYEEQRHHAEQEERRREEKAYERLRNEETEEGRAVWAAVDKAAARAPEWMRCLQAGPDTTREELIAGGVKPEAADEILAFRARLAARSAGALQPEQKGER